MTPDAIRIRRREVPAHGPWPASVAPALQRIYAARGVCTPAEGELKLARLLAPESLGRIADAARLLAEAMAADRHIVVVGDFDCDGATGTAVAVRGLRLLGARHVSYQVPNRATHGYGLSPALVEHLQALSPDLLLTVDSGIACHAGIAAAKARGWQVLVTDHHLPGEQLPSADVIVNPNVEGDPFPSKALAGVGVVFYLLLALRRHLRESGAFKAAVPDLSTLLDLVAVGTVADLVPLDYNNRLLVSAGLKRLRNGHCQPGLRALAELAGKDLGQLTAGDIGFGLAPRLNAAGRLEDMALGIECLLCDDPGRARDLAAVLDRINGERRQLQQQMVDEGERLLAALPMPSGELPAALCLLDPAWHPGVVGLVASRLKDRMHRPVFAFAPAEPGGATLKGSGRSIPGLHLRDALAAVDARYPGMVERFGGHAMAAGLSLATANFAAFREALLAQVATQLAPELLRSELLSDGELDFTELGRTLAEQLRLAGPWGQGFPEPVFDGRFKVASWKQVGERHLKLGLVPEQGGAALSAIHFGGWTGDPPPALLHVAYQLELDDWNGRRGIQLLVRHALLHGGGQLVSFAADHSHFGTPWNSVPSASESPTSRAGWIRSGGIFDFDTKVERLEEVNRELESPDVWNNAERAQALGRERSSLEKVVNGIRDLTDNLAGGAELIDLAEMEDDFETVQSVVEDVDKTEKQVEQLEFRRMFSGEMDSTNAFVDIQAGAGGTEAQDWAEILLRMYLRWCEARGWKTELMEVSGGDVAGIKSATFRVEGEYAYGWLKTETGVHRLVRKSPFDSDNRRHTSFTSVFVSPEVDDNIDIVINPADLRTDVYRSSGAGGQHVNKTESAVRITHIPTNTVVACQTGRSQHQNRDTAMKMLAARLYELEIQKRNTERDALEATKSDIGWGSQIRNYVLDQSRIKDLRTGIERSDTQKVLDGDLDEFIEASLKAGLQVGAKRSDA